MSEQLVAFEAPAAEDFALYGVDANVQIHEGDKLGWNAGNVRPMLDDDDFAGIAKESRSNVGGAAGAVLVEVMVSGRCEDAIAGLTSDQQVGAVVYALDHNSLTLSSATSPTPVGKVKKFIRTGRGVFAFNAIGLDPGADVAAALAHAEEVDNPHETTLALASTQGGFLVEELTGVGPWAQAEDSDVIILDAGDAETLTIASAVAREGRPLLIVKDNAADRIVTLAAAAGNINGAATFALPGGAQRVSALLVSDGADWHVVAQGFGLAAVLAHVAAVTGNPHSVTLEQASIAGGHKIAEISGVGPWALVDEDVDIVLIDAGDAETLTIPGAETRAGRPLTILKTNAADRVITIATDGASLINGAATLAMAGGAERPMQILISDGTNYFAPTLVPA